MKVINLNINYGTPKIICSKTRKVDMKLEILFDQDLNIAIIPGIVDIKSSTEINMIKVGRIIVNTLKNNGYMVDESELIILERKRSSGTSATT